MKRILFLNKFRRAAMVLLLLLTMTAQTAWADDVMYIDADGTECTVDATMITGETTQMGEPGETTWYYVSDYVENINRIELQGTVNLILADDCNFTARQGLHLTPGNTLNIYEQSPGNGRLYASSYSGKDAAIGGNGGSDDENQGGNGEDAGDVHIYGGVIEIDGNIGGGNGGEGFEWVVDQDCYEVCDEDPETGEPINCHEECSDIYGGGIGGNGGDGGTIYIYGGQIKVNGVIGGGYGGYGDEDWGFNGDGFIYLSWTKATDYVDIYEYHGMVTLQKLFIDEQHEIYEPGEQDDINGTKLLAPSARFNAEAAATCTEVGYRQDCWYDYVTQKYYSDEGCTQEIDESEVVIPALGHVFEHVDATPATFTLGGNMEYWHCTRCDMCFLDEDGDNAIDAADTTFEGGKGNATDGYYVLMPRLGTKTIELDNSITTFKVYDDGGADNDYSDNCNGYLVLTAPEGYAIQLTGSLLTETNWDYLTVYAGTTTDGNVLLEKKWSDEDSDDGDEYYPVSTSIGTHAASSMLLYFHSDGSKQYEGLNLTATLSEKVPHNIAIGEISGGSVSAPATAAFDDEVTLTATPTGDNLLKGITVVNNQTNEEVTVTGGTWYNNTAKFSMPNADVTVTATFSDDKSGLSINMPKTGTQTVDLTSDITSVSIYDDGGADNDYSNKCDGYLVLTAPEGYLIQLTGSLLTEKKYDYLTVYAGTTTDGNVLLEKKWSDNSNETSIGTHIASGMLLYFHSDSNQQYEGLNLTATLSEKVPYNIAIGEISGGSVTVPATAAFGDEVTLTATPTGDNLLKGITVVNNQTNEEVTVTGGTWYNNTAKFYMPNADVTVTATFSDDKSGLSINMPKTGTLTVDLTSDITSVSIYDDGGADNDYSFDCDGYLVLTAPEGYAIQLTGSLLTETNYDYLTVYAGTSTDGNVLLEEKWSDEDSDDGDEYYPVSTSIGTHAATSMLLYFFSDSDYQYEGLNLTATLVPPAESIKMNAHGIMTYASAYDLDFTSVSDLTAYVATSISGNTLTLEPVAEVPGGTGLLLRGTAGATFNVNTMDNATAINDNLLVGLTEATLVNQTTDEGIAFILANGDHGINWYKLAEESYTLKAHSAYLRLPADVAPSEARALTMVFEEASGIYSATLNENGELTDDRWHTLEGVRLSSKPAKPGIYVNNGKKTVIK